MRNHDSPHCNNGLQCVATHGSCICLCAACNAPPYARGSATSKAAAASMKHPSVSLRARVLQHIRNCGVIGATCDEIEGALDLSHQTASARVYDLRKADAIEDKGLRRDTKSGRKAVVWVVKCT